jgi:hypothetical protein
MAYQDNNRPQKQLIDVTSLGITCSECGAAITKLPFEPTKKADGTFGQLFCYDCNKKRMRDRGPRRSGFGGGNRY